MRRRLGVPPWWLWVLGFLYVGIGPEIVEFMMGPIGYWIGLVMGLGLFVGYALIWEQTRD